MTRLDAQESVLPRLLALRSEPAAARFLSGMLCVLRQSLAGDAAARMKFATVPLETFGACLPGGIRSCWIFLLRDAAEFPAERHPNSVQRMASLEGAGITEVWAAGKRESCVFDATQPDTALTIPESTWHRSRACNGDWAVISFHTAPAEELVEELADAQLQSPASSRRYHDALG